MSEWISVKDRLPEQIEHTGYERNMEEYTYLASDLMLVVTDNEVTVARYITDEGESYWQEMTLNSLGNIEQPVTHWMEIPDLPSMSCNDSCPIEGVDQDATN